MSGNVYQLSMVERVGSEEIMAIAIARDFKVRKLVFPSAEARKNAQNTVSRVNTGRLRQIGLNLTTETVDDDNTLLIRLEEYNNG